MGFWKQLLIWLNYNLYATEPKPSSIRYHNDTSSCKGRKSVTTHYWCCTVLVAFKYTFYKKMTRMKITRLEFQNQTMKNKILKIPSIYRIQRWLTTMRWHLIRLPRYVAYTECYNESICRIISGTLQLYRYYISTYSLNSWPTKPRKPLQD